MYILHVILQYNSMPTLSNALCCVVLLSHAECMLRTASNLCYLSDKELCYVMISFLVIIDVTWWHFHIPDWCHCQTIQYAWRSYSHLTISIPCHAFYSILFYSIPFSLLIHICKLAVSPACQRCRTQPNPIASHRIILYFLLQVISNLNFALNLKILKYILFSSQLFSS